MPDKTITPEVGKWYELKGGAIVPCLEISEDGLSIRISELIDTGYSFIDEIWIHQRGAAILREVKQPKASEVDASPRTTKARPADAAELIAYGATLGLDASDCEHFRDHYDANGWKQGNDKKSILDWKVALRNWKRNKGKFTLPLQ